MANPGRIGITKLCLAATCCAMLAGCYVPPDLEQSRKVIEGLGYKVRYWTSREDFCVRAAATSPDGSLGTVRFCPDRSNAIMWSTRDYMIFDFGWQAETKKEGA